MLRTLMLCAIGAISLPLVFGTGMHSDGEATLSVLGAVIGGAIGLAWKRNPGERGPSGLGNRPDEFEIDSPIGSSSLD